MRLGWLSRWYVYGPISLVLVAFVLWRARVWEAGDLLASADPGPLVLAVALNVVVVALWTLRSRLLLQHLGHGLDVGSLAMLVMFANTINGVTPASTGEVARAILLERRHGVPLVTATAVILIERFFALYLMGISVAAVVATTVIRPPTSGVILIAVAAAALAILPTIPYRLGFRPLRPLGSLVARVGRNRPGIARLQDALLRVDDQIGVTLGTTRQIVLFVAITWAIFATYAAQFSLAARSIGVGVDLAQAWGITGSAQIVGILTAVPFGLGPADTVIALVLPSLGVTATSAAIVAILVRLVGTLPLTLLGVLSYVRLSRTAAPAATVAGQPDPPLTGAERR